MQIDIYSHFPYGTDCKSKELETNPISKYRRLANYSVICVVEYHQAVKKEQGSFLCANTEHLPKY